MDAAYERNLFMKKLSLFSIVLVVILSGCSGIFDSFAKHNIDRAKSVKNRLETQIDQEAKQLVTGVKEVLESKKGRSKHEQVSLDLAEQAERLLGGEPIEKMDVELLLDQYHFDRERYKKTMAEEADLVTTLKKNELNIETEIESLENQLKGTSTWEKIKKALGGAMTLTIVVIIVLLIFAPHLLGWIVAKIPSLVSLLGVTSFRIVRNVVKGVQKARDKIAELSVDEKLDKFEILDLISSGLKEEADEDTTNTVATIRKKYNLESISRKLRDKPRKLNDKP